MKSSIIFLLWLSLGALWGQQDHFPWRVFVRDAEVANPGFHSYAWASHDSLVLVVGGRRDGLHARQPFNAFPQNFNNDSLFVGHLASGTWKSLPLSQMPVSIAEQLALTNPVFTQIGDTLYFGGGYGYVASAQDHITYPALCLIDVPGMVQAVWQQGNASSFVQQIQDQRMAITGGYMGEINGKLFVAGGHRFDGRYNPMGNPTYSQTYTEALLWFHVDRNNMQLSQVQSLSDPGHLHRRDFSLLDEMTRTGKPGYVISSGVFQVNQDLPWLYPVRIREDGIVPEPSFSQQLANYHGAHLSLFDSIHDQLHHLFLGSMSRYYYQNGQLIDDPLVPFVPTISRVSRYADSSLAEFVMPDILPGYFGASAEFVPRSFAPQYPNGVFRLHEMQADSFLLGYLLGGLESSSPNPFSANQTQLTKASLRVFEVWIKQDQSMASEAFEAPLPFEAKLLPNPGNGTALWLQAADVLGQVAVEVFDASGKRVGRPLRKKADAQELNIPLDASLAPGIYVVRGSTASGHQFSLTWVHRKE